MCKSKLKIQNHFQLLKKTKNLDINLIKYRWDLHAGSYKKLMKDIQEDLSK